MFNGLWRALKAKIQENLVLCALRPLRPASALFQPLARILGGRKRLVIRNASGLRSNNPHTLNAGGRRC